MIEKPTGLTKWFQSRGYRRPTHVTNEIRALALKRKNVGTTADLANCKVTNMSQRNTSSALVQLIQ